MSETIPGGRQRSSSEGDLLDGDEEEINYEEHGLSPSQRKVRSVHFGYVESVHPGGYSTLDRKKKYKRPSFKSVKQSVMKMVRKTVNSNDEVDNEAEHRYNVRAIVTPTLRRRAGKPAEAIDPGERRNIRNMDSFHRDYDDYSGSTNGPFLTERIIKLKGGVTPGTTGLRNHGNTCFMNAILQCLTHTDALAEYFITEQYKSDIARHNKSNAKKFGTKGEVLEQMAYLVHTLWANRYTPEISNHFKNVVGKYNPQYQGYSQHDAQEFLLWLLDKMHEDLNTVARKKYKANKSQSPRQDEDLAEEATAYSKSFVCELFQALYRSSLTCLNCSRQSNTFDPYLCVSLPLPQKVLRPVYVTIVYADARPKQVKIGLQLNVHDSVRDLRKVISSETKIPESRLVLTQIYDDGFRHAYGDHQPLSDIPEPETIYAIEMLPIIHPEEYQTSFIQIIFVNVLKVSGPSRCYRFCSPHVMQIPRDLDFKEIQTQILKHMGEDIREGLLNQAQRLNVLFRLRIVDGLYGKGSYLNPEVEMPLYVETVDRALSSYSSENRRGYGLPHIKLVVEWDPDRKESIVVNDSDRVEELTSVQQVRQTLQKTPGASLDECFQLYTQEEKLSGDDAWLCPHCKKQQQGTMKKLGLWSLPDVFVVHLKRFKQTGSRRNKLNTLVNFPVNGLNMGPHLVQRTINNNTRYTDVNLSSGNSHPDQQMALLGGSDQDIYDLYAVCNHYGDMCGGHYTAFCKNPVDEKWYTFDDSRVTPMHESEVVNKAAYLLFYQRRSRFQNRFSELQHGNHWVFQLNGLVDTSALGQFVSPPSSPAKSRLRSTSPVVGRRKASASSPQAATDPPSSPPMQRHLSMPPSMRQGRKPPGGTSPNTGENVGRSAYTPANESPEARSSESKPPTHPNPSKLPQNHTVTFNVDQKYSHASRPAELFVALPRERSSSRSGSGSSPRSPSSGRSASKSPNATSPQLKSCIKPSKVLSPIPYADDHRKPPGLLSHPPPVQSHITEPTNNNRPTPRSKSHDNFRQEELQTRVESTVPQKYHTIGRTDRPPSGRDYPNITPQSVPPAPPVPQHGGSRNHPPPSSKAVPITPPLVPHHAVSHASPVSVPTKIMAHAPPPVPPHATSPPTSSVSTHAPPHVREHFHEPYVAQHLQLPESEYGLPAELVDHQSNYTRVISPQPFPVETHSLDRYSNSERFPRYQPQRHYAYLRYTHAARQARPPVEPVKGPNCLKESSV